MTYYFRLDANAQTRNRAVEARVSVIETILTGPAIGPGTIIIRSTSTIKTMTPTPICYQNQNPTSQLVADDGIRLGSTRCVQFCKIRVPGGSRDSARGLQSAF